MMQIQPTRLRSFGQGWGTERITPVVRQIRAISNVPIARSEVHIFERWLSGKDRKSLLWKRQRVYIRT